MNDIPFVQVMDGAQHLANSLRGILFGELAILANAVEQLTTSGQLCDNVEFILPPRKTGERLE